MNKIEQIKEELLDRSLDIDKSVFFIEPSFEDAIIGISNDGNIVYSFEKMVEYLMVANNFDTQESIDFITYNTIPSLENYINENKDEDTFQTKLFKLIDERGLKDSDVYNKVDIDRRLFSKIRSNRDYHPSKETNSHSL